jgi:DNA polymerase-3 subunit epsilon/CBS domain-containing protein
MPAAGYATPLLALDAVVIDTEATGLDPRKARVVEIAAVRIIGGRIAVGDTFQSLVNPGRPIPAEATAIHGIDDARVASAPDLATLWPAWSGFVGEAPWIGHAIGFDLAVLARGCREVGIAWTQPRALCTRLLAELVEPGLADFTIERIAAWLDVEVAGRHSALGDAMTAARIFVALIPRLRERGVRTVGEALQACRAVTHVLDDQKRAGWAEVVDAPRDAEVDPVLLRLDSYPYRHRVRDVMRRPPEFVAANASVRDALAFMMERRISSLYVHELSEPRPRAAEAGIVTERDILRATAEHGARALDTVVKEIMSRPLIGVPADDFVYRAIGRMSRLNIRHLAALDVAGHIVGALSARDLLRLRAGEAVSLGDEIEQSSDIHDLAAAWFKVPQVARSLIAEGVSGRDIAGVVSRELCALTSAVARIAEQRMQQEGYGAPPCGYAFAVLGSGGRGESLLAMDQDNALVFAEGDPGGSADRWFETLAQHVADMLDQVGVPYCKGGIMAKNSPWRGSLATWNARIDDWIGRSRPEDLLAVDIFFDLRAVHGDLALAERLRLAALDAARGNAVFAKLLAEAAGSVEPGIGLFGRIKTVEGRIDLKKSGLFGIVTAARALAICHHIAARSTPARLAGIANLGLGVDSDLDLLVDAHGTLMTLLAAQQVDDIQNGIPPTNAVSVKRLSAGDRDRLRSSLMAVSHLETFTRDLLFEKSARA